jgi:hypothetical protein
MGSMQIDLRQNHRFQARVQSFVNLHNQANNIHILGQLLDISQSGLALSYLPEIYGAMPPARPNESFKLDIFISGNALYLEGFPSRLIYDHRLPSFSPITVVTTRKCGLAFTGLTDFQDNQLRHFIRRSFYAFA